MEQNISKLLFIAGIIYFIIGVYVNIESTLYFNETQFVPDGEEPEPIRMAELISDVWSPAKEALVLIALSYILKRIPIKKEGV